MKKIILIFTMLVFAHVMPAQNPGAMLTQYMNVKNALVSSDSKASTQASESFLQSIKEAGEFEHKKALLKSAEKMVKANGIEKQRSDFNEVSTTMWKVIKSADKMNEPVYFQYCPMKKYYWLSMEKEIKNPYYGSSMLNCGKVVETKP